ncbi:MAG: hypothetical protein ACLQUY_04990 [Ktedonobacterales bacterium]
MAPKSKKVLIQLTRLNCPRTIIMPPADLNFAHANRLLVGTSLKRPLRTPSTWLLTGALTSRQADSRAEPDGPDTPPGSLLGSKQVQRNLLQIGSGRAGSPLHIHKGTHESVTAA